ncbi:MAG: TIGR04282 family arsenosugar biosynthesis glycosyltransferase [Deltaproteobacteria bacterium]|nr:TIGR04282 family arsenosugar biosynthesis glycosyltransferase [Deltaproteobacteria bacterium]
MAELDQRRLAIFARYPAAGASKTRLIPALGERGAADLHRRLAEAQLRRARALTLDNLRIEVHFTGADRQAMHDWLGEEIVLYPQSSGDLGDRMFAALAIDSTPTVIIGTDAPGLDAPLLTEAFAALQDHALVLGPASDGGYYLIGCTPPPRRELFSAIDWGSERVLAQTLERAGRLGITPHLLGELDDIDRPEDLALLDA